MSDLYAEVNVFTAEANKLRSDYSRIRQEIKDDPNLSIQGRRNKLDAHFEAYKGKHDDLIKRYKTWRESSKEAVIRDVYSHPIYKSSGAEALRPLVEKAEQAYDQGREAVKGLAERAVNMRDREQVRALVATAYARRDWKTLEGLESTDRAVSQALDYERLFGGLASPQTLLNLNVEMRAPTKYE